MPDIFDEVEEDLRAERARSLARRFGWLAALAMLVVVAGTGAYVWWSQRSTETAVEVANSFIAAGQLADKSVQPLTGVDHAKASEAAAQFAAIAAHGPAGYATLARLRLASLQWELGEQPAAVATWAAVSNDAGAPQLLRDLATITSAQHQVDTGNTILLKQTVEGLTALDNPWRPIAEQVIAMIDLREGHTKEAADILRRLSTDPLAPEGIRQMVADILTTLPAESAKPEPAKPAPTAKTPSPAAAPAKPATHG